MKKLRTQIASDVSRDAIGVELLNDVGDVVAELFSSDRERQVPISTFGNSVALYDIEQLIQIARERLGSFEDGTPWPNSPTSTN